MSSYLNIYLVPKKQEESTEEPKPLRFMSYSRNNEIYQSFKEYITYMGISDEPNYTEITEKMIGDIIANAKDSLDNYEKSLKIRQDTIEKFKEKLSVDAIEEYMQDFSEITEYIEELKEHVIQLEFIQDLITDLRFSDFEKIVANID